MEEASPHPHRPALPDDTAHPGAWLVPPVAAAPGPPTAPSGAGSAPPFAPPVPPVPSARSAYGPPPGPPPAADLPGSAAPGRRPARGRRLRRTAGATGLAALALLGGVGGGWLEGTRDDRATTTVTAAAADRASLTLAGGNLDVAGVLDHVRASVVSVETSVSVRQGRRTATGSGAGTGVVLDDQGHILTNAHVVEGATSVTVTLDGVSRPATVVDGDAAADIAVLHVDDTSGLQAADFGESDGVQVGDEVVAVGNALALEGGLTVTRGIVSATDRSIDTDTGSLSGLLQTDAAISSGNSGGALVDATGKVIGINTAVATSSGTVSAANIGFVIPADSARQTAARLLAAR